MIPEWAIYGEDEFHLFRECVRYAEVKSLDENYGLKEYRSGWAWWYPRYKTGKGRKPKLLGKNKRRLKSPQKRKELPLINKVVIKKKRCVFLRSKEWKEMRDIILGYYGKVCMKCGSTQKIQVDHIKPRAKYPELALELMNLQVLCWPCNKDKRIKIADYRF